jgi:hypothetical protein
MNIFWVLLCGGGVAFWTRVLVALVNELRSSAHRGRPFRHLTFRPSRNRAELVEIRSDAVTRRFPAGTPERIAVFLFSYLAMAKTASTFATLIKF